MSARKKQQQEQQEEQQEEQEEGKKWRPLATAESSSTSLLAHNKYTIIKKQHQQWPKLMNPAAALSRIGYTLVFYEIYPVLNRAAAGSITFVHRSYSVLQGAVSYD